jgi:hypothetical protein
LREPTYNLFLYVEQDAIKELGVVVHDLEGTEEEKLSALQALVDQDYRIAKRYRLQDKIEWGRYQALERLGRHLEVFEQIFRDCSAPINPLVAITPIVDHLPKIMAVTGLGALDLDQLQNTPLAQPGVMVDYLKTYVADGRLDVPRLFNDDYFEAIKLLYNARHWVSAAKLLMSFLDTVAFVDMGDLSGNFALWLDKYANLGVLGITSKELWEYRNGLLHMTNLNSRAVARGVTAPLILYVGSMPQPMPSTPDGAKYFNLKELVDTVALAISKWIEDCNSNPSKWVDFVKRYDLTVSDSRVAYFSFE